MLFGPVPGRVEFILTVAQIWGSYTQTTTHVGVEHGIGLIDGGITLTSPSGLNLKFKPVDQFLNAYRLGEITISTGVVPNQCQAGIGHRQPRIHTAGAADEIGDERVFSAEMAHLRHTTTDFCKPKRLITW